MNLIRHLGAFIRQVAQDDRLYPSHISLYMAIFVQWEDEQAGEQRPISVTRQQLMTTGKIHSKATYHKCIRELHDFGYIDYRPSYTRSHITLLDTCSINEQVIDKGSSIDEHLQAVSSSINEHPDCGSSSINEHLRAGSSSIDEPPTTVQNNNVLNINSMKSIYNPIDQPPLFAKSGVQKMNISKQKSKKSTYIDNIYNNLNDIDIKKKKKSSKEKKETTPPDLQQVIGFFIDKNMPLVEAEKFFNHYQANGWKVGKNPMKNWQASARNWILNIGQFANIRKTLFPSPGKLQATTQKDFSEPL
ncbi:MAG: hypothetical protein FWG54_06105 [Bacteroidetes bacterium]|nr:hypothetical protein [Bacteroidota bacterium]